MSGDNDGEKPSGALPLASSIGSRNLIIIIVTMPLVFAVVLLGTILVFGKHKRVAAAEAGAALPALETSARSSASSGLAPAPLILPAGADIASMALDGDRLVLRVVNADGEDGEIVVYDLAAGAAVQRIPVISQFATE